MRHGWLMGMAVVAGLLAGGREARAQRPAQAAVTVSATVVVPASPDTLRAARHGWLEGSAAAGAAPSAVDTLARRSRLVLAYTGV